MQTALEYKTAKRVMIDRVNRKKDCRIAVPAPDLLNPP